MTTDYIVIFYDAPTEDGDGQLGAPANRNLVVMNGAVGFTQYNLVFNEDFSFAIRRALESDGFDVVKVAFQNDTNFELHVNVNQEYSAEQARQRAEYVISSIVNKLGWQVFTDVNLKVVNNYVTTTNYKPAIPPEDPFKFVKDALAPTNLFGTAGLSIGLVAVVLGTIIIFKR